MKLSDRFDGSGAPFEGDRTSLLRSLPAGAQIHRAVAVISPIDATRGEDPFAETITFARSSGDWGATKRVATAAAAAPVTDNWVEVDFHRRRTLAGLRGTNLNPSTLQVDLGGAYVEINTSGGLLTPEQNNPFTVTADGVTLPGLTVTKLKLTGQSTTPPRVGAPDVTEVTVRSVPSNLTLRLGTTPAVWAHVGEMTQPEATPDFALALQDFLAGAEVENGFYVVPLVLHSDTIARLTVELEVEYLLQESVLPEGLTDVVLPFDFGGTPKSGEDALLITVPANSRVAPRGVKARVAGTFAETRVVYAPTDGLAPSGAVDVSPATPQAQPVMPPSDVKATAVDLLLNVERPARLQLDVRDDLDGKPGSVSLLPAPVAFDVPGPVGMRPDPQEAQRFKWLSVPLPAELQLGGGKMHWLVLQSIAGAAKWRVAAAPAAGVGIQRTQDGGMSWRETALAGVPGAVAAFYRLRRKPERFEMPVALQVGAGERAVVVSLDRFQPSGRVDFTLDLDEVSQAVNKYLAGDRAGACAGSEHLANGDFEKWQAVGDRLGEPVAIAVGEGIEAQFIAFPPDGRLAYVGGDDVIGFVDAACDELVPDRLGLSSTPRAIVFHPDGTRAYIASGDAVLVLDTLKRKVLDGSATRDAPVRGMAVSPDGSRLFVAEEHAAWAISSVELEEAVLPDKATLDEKIQATLVVSETQQLITALAIAPDGGRLYVSIRNGPPDSPEANGEVRIYETSSLQLVAAPIAVGQRPVAIALSPDGRRAVVANEGSNSVSILDLQRGVVLGSVAHNEPPVGVAVLPDGRRALVIRQEGQTVDLVDLERRTVAQSIELESGPARSLAVSTQGDRVYVGVAGAQSLFSIPLGVRLPVEWNVTSGRVRPVCLPAPAHLAALLGSLVEEEAVAASLSQVVPVVASCLYEFSFWGVANQPDALAELFWLVGDCGLSRADRVPVAVVQPVPVVAAPPVPGTPAQPVLAAAASTLAAAFASTQTPNPVLHRATFESPPGAEQAEIRFSTPAGAAAIIDRVSLTATAESIANADFKLFEQGQLSGWTLSPANAAGASLVAAEGAPRLRNAGADEVELTQSVAVEGGQPFELEFQGGAESRQPARGNSRLEVRWLGADGSRAGDPAVLNIDASGFGSSLAKGVSPAGATQAEISLAVSPGTTQEVRRISLRFPKPSLVPLTFVSQAPGDLTVTDLQVAFEQAAPTPPPIPSKGLCASTPAGMSPGDECGGDEGFCPCCGHASKMTEVEHVVTPAGRPARVVRCADCGTEAVRVGGPRVAGAKTLAATRLEVRRPVVQSRRVPTAHHHHAEEPQPHDHGPAGEDTEAAHAAEVTEAAHAKQVTEAAPPAPPVALPPLTAISGIGEARARQLAEMGITTVAELAAANPQDLTRLRLVTLKLAEQLVAQAKALTETTSGNP